MTIKRTIDGQIVTIPLTEDELRDAYYLLRERFLRENCEDALRDALCDTDSPDALDNMSEAQRNNIINTMVGTYEQQIFYHNASHDDAIFYAVDESIADMGL